jgi:hypothetical protein
MTVRSRAAGAVRAWLAWFETESGRFDPAEALLAADGCPVEVREREPLWPEDLGADCGCVVP